MNLRLSISALLAVWAMSGPVGAAADAADSAVPAWPEITRENKPWTRWWWPGSAVDKASLTHQLEQFAAAGLGGVEITPIYGAKGAEDRSIDYLSPKWLEMLEHTAREAQRLGLGVDMATGTGWPFGGPWVTGAEAAQQAVLADGRLAGTPTKMMVKRAAPGGEGFVIDPFSPAALRRYLAPFDRAFANFPRGLVRGQFHDSFEYYNANWTPNFDGVFREMHGYDVQRFAAELLAASLADVKTVDADTLGRVRSDYRETLARLHLDYLRTWVQWSHEHGFLVRNQSHGAPANLLDLYANADIAETEVFGSTPFPIPGLRRYADEVRSDQDLPESLVIRMASSAAHVAGHPLASSESLTWLREHWKESPSYMKPELDRLLVNGINHVFYHGTVFSPQDAPWPGWLFYASTQFNPNNPLWDDLGALNRYVGRVQSVLQSGTPDNDILLYWPVYDLWDSNGDSLAQLLTVHNVKWLTEQPVGKLAGELTAKGYQFDYVSDAQLAQTTVKDGRLATAGASYKLLVVPATRRMPLATLRQLLELARAGAPVQVLALPEDVPGFGELEARRSGFRQLLAEAKRLGADKRRAFYVGAGAGSAGLDAAALAASGVAREPVADSGIGCIRRAIDGGHDYFLVNQTARPFDDWVALGSPATAAAFLDPLTGKTGAATLQTDDTGRARVFLQLAPGESLLLRTAARGALAGPQWKNTEPAGDSVALAGTWKIGFLKGGPVLPPALETTTLESWTELGGEDARRFAGTARYRLEFDAPAARADDWRLDLGDVRETALVRLNGREVGIAWCLPLQLCIGEYLKPGRNVLEIDVTNLAANRIRDLDRRGVAWKNMREINFVNIGYQPFDASKWGLTPSGLLGPVRLVPLRRLAPQP